MNDYHITVEEQPLHKHGLSRRYDRLITADDLGEALQEFATYHKAELKTAQGWTYVDDEMPPFDTVVELTTFYPDIAEDATAVDYGYCRFPERDWYSRYGTPIEGAGGGQVIAWRFRNQPAPLRTAANAGEATL